MDSAIAREPKVTGQGLSQMGMARNLVKVIEDAEKLASKMGDSYVTSEHLLIALADEKGTAGSVLTTAGVTAKRLTDAYESLRGDERVTSADARPEFEALERYGRNVTHARPGRAKLDPVDRAAWRRSAARSTVLSRRT
ncbi:protein containing Clp, partial [gut metagenome]